MPQPADFVILLDGAGRPRFIWRTNEVTIKPLSQVDEAFAWDEGEGDRTREWWLDADRPREATHEGFEIDDEILTVFERFEVVWPLEVADGINGPTASNIEPRSQSKGLAHNLTARSQKPFLEAWR